MRIGHEHPQRRRPAAPGVTALAAVIACHARNPAPGGPAAALPPRRQQTPSWQRVLARFRIVWNVRAPQAPEIWPIAPAAGRQRPPGPPASPAPAVSPLMIMSGDHAGVWLPRAPLPCAITARRVK